jgi:LAGLIDADG-like domain
MRRRGAVPRQHVLRAEMSLARADRWPLRELQLDPDPLTGFVQAYGTLNPALAETAEVCIDLVPLRPAQMARRRRRIERADRSRGAGQGGATGLWGQVAGAATGSQARGGVRSPGAAGSYRRRDPYAVGTVGARTMTRDVAERLYSWDPTFAIQVLIRVTSADRARARSHLGALVAAFGVWSGANSFRQVGLHVGPVLLGGANAPWRRALFDRRWRLCRFSPAKPAVVSTAEIAGVLKPPSSKCPAPNVLRSGGVVPAAPRSLPTYQRQAGLLPLGWISAEDGERPVGVPLADTLFALRCGKAGWGKALALDTPIPSPHGWTTMGELREGDRVFDEAGEPCMVTFATDVMVGHQCYEVEFSDGARIVADAEHNWVTRTVAERNAASAARHSVARRQKLGSPAELEVLAELGAATQPDELISVGELAEMVGRLHTLYDVSATMTPAGVVVVPAIHPRWRVPSSRPRRAFVAVELIDQLRARLDRDAFDQRHTGLPACGVRTTEEIRSTLVSRNGAANHSVDLARPLQYPERKLSAAPYVLGAWLGDGTNANQGITCADPEILDFIQDAGYEVKPWGRTDSRPYAWKIGGDFGSQLRQLGLINNKHIPRFYLEASPEQRLSLLQGLMDTDGHISKGGNAEFTTTRRRLADDVLELVTGLGFKASLTTGRAMLEGRDCGEKYRVRFTPDRPVVRLARKAARLKEPSQLRVDHLRRRYIVAVRPVASVAVRCITVDSPSHLYLAGSACIPTHNTEGAIVQFVSLARSGHGCMFLDPHADALERVKPYLVDIADRVVEINLSPRGRSAAQAGWNLFSMEGRDEDDIEGRVSAVVQSFASTLRWGEINNRAITLTTMAAQSMCELALLLPAGLAPTLFQMSKMLSDEDWRASVVPHLTAPLREFWEDIFERMSDEAITPVTNLITRLRSSATVAAMFGSSQSTYDIRTAMDEGKVVLACPAGGGDKDRLVANFLVYDVLQALLSRKRDRDTAPERRRPFYLFIDELQTVDGATGGNLAAMLEESRKFGGRLLGMVQQPTRLTDKTLEALLNNLSHLSSTNVSSDQARLVAAEWAGRVDPDTLTQLPKYHFISSVTLNGQLTPPFKSRGFELGQLWGDVAQPGRVADLDRTVDATMRRRPVGTVLAELDTLSARIRNYLEYLQPGPAGPARGDSVAGPSREPSPGGGRGSGGGTRLRVVGS